MASRSNIEALEKIENLQQELITHIRTSGIRKPRETSLIDEVLEIRRETRRLCNVLNGSCNASNEAIEKLRNDLAEMTVKRNENQQEELKTLKAKCEDLQREKDALELKLREETKAELEKNNFVHKLRFDKLRQKYEQAISSVEAKLNDVTKERTASDGTTIEREVQKQLAVEKAKLEEQYVSKFQSYKKALVSVSNREKEMEQAIVQQQELNQAFEAQNSKLKKSAFLLESAVEESRARESELIETNRALTEQLSQRTAEVSQLRAEGEEARRRIEGENDKRLAAIDEKIRRMLEAKDAEIHRLQGEKKYSEMKLREAERLLDSINSEFRQVKEGSRGAGGGSIGSRRDGRRGGGVGVTDDHNR